MRKVIFVFGIAVGFLIGSWAGRERFDQIVGLGQKAASHPKVVDARQAATAKAGDLGKSAVAKVPDMAKSAAPKIASAAKSAGQTAASRLPFGGKVSTEDPFDEATDSADAQVPYQADGSSADASTTAFNGARAE